MLLKTVFSAVIIILIFVYAWLSSYCLKTSFTDKLQNDRILSFVTFLLFIITFAALVFLLRIIW